jgi:tetratricopeptide (TPR) repeat protein
MVSRILAFYFAVAGLWTVGSAVSSAYAQSPPSPDPDELYRHRDNIAMAKQAADIYAARAVSGKDFENSWKLARACYWLGTQGPDAERRPALDRGVKAGQQAADLQPNKPEGHFWMAANMGALAQSYGLTQGIKYRGRIKDALERVLAMEPAWQQGSADRALGWWYHMVPTLFGGSEQKAEDHLRKALTYNTQSTATLYFLGEVLLERNKKAEAKSVLQMVLTAPNDPDWTPEDLDFKKKATETLSKVR